MSMDAKTALVKERLARLQGLLAEERLQALVIPSSDPHVSEYVPARWQGRVWFSGFTGSLGTLVVMPDHAALFADGLYWDQAEAELEGTGIELVRTTAGSQTGYMPWLAERMTGGSVVCVDGRVLALVHARQLRATLEAAGIELRSEQDLLDRVWPDRPPLPSEPIFEHLPPHATVGRGEKLTLVRREMEGAGATHHFVSSVDDLAWITNLRGSDVPYNPTFIGHLLLDAERATLFVAEGKVDAALRQRLLNDGIEVAPYEAAGDALARCRDGAAVLVDPRRVTAGMVSRLPASTRLVEQFIPSTLAKSRKNDAEAAHIREAMEQDGAAMCEFYAWFESALGRERITELTVDERLAEARARRPGFMGLSFGTIAGFNGNGAMPHYRPSAQSHSVIEGDGLLLIDSGGQYLGGTTDITRVWKIDEITTRMRRDFTLVLRGTIALSRVRFPRGTLSPTLDSIARLPLWSDGLDYNHGTGHGVGYFLSVHEGPQTIRKSPLEPQMALEPGMVTSVEPAVYRKGQWGVRIENLVLAVPCLTGHEEDYGEFLEFETLTLCPIDTRCIERELLRPDEVEWLNAYHETVRRRIGPHVGGAALAWLEERTRRI
jgi:Xaa-Pro aminopeptidase